MRRFLPYRRSGLAAAALLTAGAAMAMPAAPGNFKAEVNGLIVDLTWDWGNTGDRLLFQDFENEQFPPAGWDNERGYTINETGNWMRYSFDKDDEGILTHSGLSCAMIMMAQDMDEEDPTTIHQDEWLITAPGAGAEYMEFWYFIHPELLEVGGYQDFPDHYYVMISRDKGDTWTELWDARWDMGNSDDMQSAALFLGEPADENTLVAFNAVSAEEESLYFLWIVDDVEFYSAREAASAPRPRLTTRKPANLIPEGITTHREFRHDPSMKRVARIPESEWLNAGQTTFRIYRDDEIAGDYIKALHFTDYESKEKGTHTYRIMAWNEADDKEYEASSLTVEIDEFEFLPPRNVKGYWAQLDNGKYQIAVGWEAPEGDMMPAYYNAYINDKSIGRVDLYDDYEIGQHGLVKGSYKLSVEAVYQYPEGTSERIDAYVFPGTVPAPINLSTEIDGAKCNLTWEMPTTDDFKETPKDYSVYRGDMLLGRTGGAMNFTDPEMEAGHYSYSVHAEYEDGSVSLPATANVENGDAITANLPIKEEFSNGHLPAHWDVTLTDPYGRVKEMYKWRFDNWFDLEVSEDAGITGGFASVSCLAAGMNRLESALVTPQFEVPASGDTYVEFCRWYEETEVGPSGPAICELQIRADGEEEWKAIADLNSADRGLLSVKLNDYAGKKVTIRWAIVGRNSGQLAVDNVVISNSALDGVRSVTDVTAGRFDIITPAGMVIRRNAEAADAASLPAGVYILRSHNGETAKIAVK